jgi:hypothetical protein
MIYGIPRRKVVASGNLAPHTNDEGRWRSLTEASIWPKSDQMSADNHLPDILAGQPRAPQRKLLDKIKEDIPKTGFVTEMVATAMLKDGGWVAVDHTYYMVGLSPCVRGRKML